MNLLQDLAKHQRLKEKIMDMVQGKKINKTKNRAKLHVVLYSDDENAGNIFVDEQNIIFVDEQDITNDMHSVLNQIKSFADNVQSGKIR